MDLYENTLIGTFLYGLGVEVGAHAGDQPLPASVDLLQQTPLDKSLADVLIQSPTFIRLFEFKRDVNRDSKEFKKRTFLERALSAEKDALQLRSIANAIHWHIESISRPGTSPILSATPYFGGDADVIDVATLCKRTAAAMGDPSALPAPNHCARYLSLIRKTGGVISKGSGGGSTLLVAVKDGIIMHAHVNDLTDITLRHSQLAEVQRALKLTLDRERSKLRDASLQRLREVQAKRELDRDNSMGIG